MPRQDPLNSQETVKLRHGPPSLAHDLASYGGHPSRALLRLSLLAAGDENGGWPATRSSLRFRRAKGGGPDLTTWLRQLEGLRLRM